MRIGELAAATGVSARSLRYYEDVGLIGSTRAPNGWRRYDAGSVARVIEIQHLFAAGLCSTTIATLLPCLTAPAAERTGLLERVLEEEVERLEQRRRDVERELEVLRALREQTLERPGPPS
ncbi:MerR family transcriptional regulator [Nocardioides dongxiaopingii]|uniref:MerR family transcriptional regulator n=1 Tax=Nocardioides TaxID=1839 RepID=UPI0010C76C32|nr:MULTISPECIES: MerR family transcriptional regulator [Nocardioides]QCW49402.1 MerR family transcriptional regulator [Nocardioides sp. S-1144]